MALNPFKVGKVVAALKRIVTRRSEVSKNPPSVRPGK